MKAKVKLTPEMLERLADGKELTFKIQPGVDTLEVLLVKKGVDFDEFDEVFSKLWDSVLSKLEKIASRPLK